MKTSNVILTVTATKTKAIFEISLQRTGKETWLMGNSSFLINFDKYCFRNPVMTYVNPFYSSGVYKPLRMEILLRRILGLQIEIQGMPERIVPLTLEKIAVVEFDYIGNYRGVAWRGIDTAIVDPNFQEVVSNYSIQFK